MPTRAGRALGVGVGVAVCLVALVGLFNAIVDPFGTTRWIERTGFNAYKPAIQTRVRLVKAVQVLQVRPRSIVLGTSRSHVGLRMTHAGWPAGPRYNLAFDGATPEEMYAYLRHAEAARPLTLVVLGLDTWQLEGNPSSVRPDFDPNVLLRPHAPLTRLRAALERMRLALSWDTFAASVRTLRSQGHAPPDWFSPDGQRLGEVFFHRPGEAYETVGPRRYFLDTDRQEIGFKLPDVAPPAAVGRPKPPSAPPVSSFEYLRKIVAFCRDNDIRLLVFITPAHAHQMEIAYLMGEAPAIERGKRRLVRLLADDGRSHRAEPYPLWDFSGYSPVTEEPLPPAGSRREMRYYWDSSHFKQGVGDWVLDRLFSTAPRQLIPAGFGSLLRPDTVDSELARIRAGHEAYARAHPDDEASLLAMLSEARKAQPSEARP